MPEYLDVPGAKLCYEKVGTGPLFLCVSGGNGSGDIWTGFAQFLKDQFTVVYYDRRGFSRSQLFGSQDYERRLETDVEDAAALIKHFSPNDPATVIGNSSGAIVSLKLVAAYPNLVSTLVSHEPPASKLLPDFDDLWKRQEEVYATYRRNGIYPAVEKFAALTKMKGFSAGALEKMLDPTNGFTLRNMEYWFEREFMYHPKADFDVDKEFEPVKNKLILIVGELSDQEAYQVRPNYVLAEKLGLQVILVPGEHVAHATHAEAFAKKIIELVNARRG